MKEKLHTDELEEKYGPVHAVLSEHTKERRVINIVDGIEIVRTHAVTWFTQDTDVDSAFNLARDEIRNGQLIGKTFKKYGFSIEKVPVVDGVVCLPGWLKDAFRTDVESAMFRIYEFVTCGGDGVKHLYGVVCEIDSPDFILPDFKFSDNQREDSNRWLKKLEDYLGVVSFN